MNPSDEEETPRYEFDKGDQRDLSSHDLESLELRVGGISHFDLPENFCLTRKTVPDKILTLSTEPDSFYMDFHQDGRVIGKLYEKDSKLNFEGEVEESAKIFIDEIIKLWKMTKG